MKGRQSEGRCHTSSVGKTYDRIDGRLAEFISKQPVFFVATAPLASDGHVNCSPKGANGSFAILGERRVAYQDMTGSGIETIAHLRENGRIVVMFCAFEGPPRIVRLHGRGEVVASDHPEFDELVSRFSTSMSTRAVILVEVTRISDSCGYGVPLMTFEAHRENLDHWAETKGPEGLLAYRAEKNRSSIDGLPGLEQGDGAGGAGGANGAGSDASRVSGSRTRS
jgi:Pyridoxamine 5'-phosphate oxidase